MDLASFFVSFSLPSFHLLLTLFVLSVHSLQTFCQLVNLTVLDVTKNKLERFPPRFSQLSSLCDLHASENCIEALPEDFGKSTPMG